MEVRSGCACPMCGKEMKLMSGGFYYEHCLGVVDLCCHDCNLEIKEFAFEHGLKNGEANSYGKLVNALRGRVRK